jgi:hypothetical protein
MCSSEVNYPVSCERASASAHFRTQAAVKSGSVPFGNAALAMIRFGSTSSREQLSSTRVRPESQGLNVVGHAFVGPVRPERRYSVVIVSGVVTTTGGRMNVPIRLTANSTTAVSSINAETGRTVQAQAA